MRGMFYSPHRTPIQTTVAADCPMLWRVKFTQRLIALVGQVSKTNKIAIKTFKSVYFILPTSSRHAPSTRPWWADSGAVRSPLRCAPTPLAPPTPGDAPSPCAIDNWTRLWTSCRRTDSCMVAVLCGRSSAPVDTINIQFQLIFHK